MCPKTSKAQLSPQQRLFVHEYLIDRNATEAAIKAGYSRKTAGSQGSRLLKNVNIAALIEEGLARLQKKTEVTAEKVINELALIAFSDMADYVTVDTDGSVQVKPFEQMPPGASRVISKLKEKRRILGSGEGDGKDVILDSILELAHHDKVAALMGLGKHFGIFKEKIEVSGALTLEQLVVASRRDDIDSN